MVKKYSKLLITILFAFFAALATSSALELTLDELAEEALEVNPKTTYVYVIGEHAFTSGFEIKTEDIMYAARSIKVDETKDVKEQMVITYLRGTFNDDLDLNGFEFVSNVVGSEKAPLVYDIKYINYVEVELDIDVDELVKEAYDVIEGQAANNDKFTVNMPSETEINVVLKDKTMTSVEALMGTGVATAAANFLETEGVKGVTLKLGESELTITEETLTPEAVDAFFEELGTTVADLIDRTMTATILFEDGYKTANSVTFDVTFKDVPSVVNF